MQGLKLLALTGVCALAFGIAPASAEDEMSTGFDWSGMRVGVFGGYQSSDIETTELFTEAFGGGWYFPPGPNANFNLDDGSGFGGLTAGWDKQLGNIVLGVGAEIGYMGIDASILDPYVLPHPTPDEMVVNFDGGLFGSITARGGVAFDRLLIFARGGLSVLDASGTTIDECGRSFCGQLTIEADGNAALLGFNVGGGIEYALTDSISIGAEYRYYRFESLHVSGIATNNLLYKQTKTPEVHSVRGTLNFRF